MDQQNETVSVTVEPYVKKGRGRPRLTEAQRQERDERRYAAQREYYLKNKERIVDQQKAVKNEKYSSNPDFREKAIQYIKAYNKRRTAICQFVTEWAEKDKTFQEALGKYLLENL